MSEAVQEGKGDKDDSEINLPIDLNDSTFTASNNNNTSSAGG